MFKLLLILKYLRRKLAPLFAALAVMLCTAMVIIVMSVMGGFLENFRASAHALTGDIVVEGPLQGFTGYEELVAAIEALPEIEAAAPMLRAVGLVNFRETAKPVQLQGVDFQKLEQIVGYKKTLLWSNDQLREHVGDPQSEIGKAFVAKMTRDFPIDPGPEAGATVPALGLPEAVMGIEVYPFQRRNDDGDYVLERSRAGEKLPVTVIPLTESGTVGTIEPVRKEVLITNEVKSGLYDIDASAVVLPFSTLQTMLNMQPRTGFTDFDPNTGRGGEEVAIAGRANQVVVKIANGVDLLDARDAVQAVINGQWEDRPLQFPPQARTWEEVHQNILGAVENEKGLVTFLFGIIGLVAVVMVATTFYMIVLEKTRDIGVLRAIGASRGGIMGLFVGYGLAIGVVGSLLGLAIAVAIVTNLNEIQGLLNTWFGWQMWDPKTYFFDRIPDTVNYSEALRVVAGAIVSSVVGALIPAWIAGRLKPVDALRYE